MAKNKEVLKDVMDIFDKKQAYSYGKEILPSDFKDLKHSTSSIVTMLGHLIQNQIVICRQDKRMHFNQEAWQMYCAKTRRKWMIACVSCVVISVLVVFVMMGVS